MSYLSLFQKSQLLVDHRVRERNFVIIISRAREFVIAKTRDLSGQMRVSINSENAEDLRVVRFSLEFLALLNLEQYLDFSRAQLLKHVCLSMVGIQTIVFWFYVSGWFTRY